MSVPETEVRTYIVEQLERLAKDWDYSEGIGPDSLLFSELGFESLDAVVLAVSIQEHFGRQMPFTELFARLGEERRDLSVRELIEFTASHLPAAAPAAKGGSVQ